MPLDYLDFDYSEDDEGTGSWDALASVTSERMPALTEEVQQLLRWAHRFAGRPGPIEDGGEWDYDLQVQQDDGQPLPASYDSATGRLHLSAPAGQRCTLSLTLSARAAFSQALRERFELE